MTATSSSRAPGAVSSSGPEPSAPPASPRVGAEAYGAAGVLSRIRATVKAGVRERGRECTFQAMGTRCRIFHGASGGLAGRFEAAALAWVAGFEAKYSRFLEGSLISRINREAGGNWVEIDPDTERVLAMCHEMVFLTRGIFDPTALPLVRLWDWKASPPVVPGAAAVEEARARVGWSKVQRVPGKVRLAERGMCLDLGGMGKEFAVDQVVLLAVQMGVPSVLVDFGADVRVHGMPPDGRPGWHIGLEDPAKPGSVWRGLAVRNAAVATSGDYLRRFEYGGRRYGHIIDCRTGEPVDNGCCSASVVASSCVLAGMLSTAGFVLGPDEGLRLIEAQPGAAGAFVTRTGTQLSRRFHEYVAS